MCQVDTSTTTTPDIFDALDVSLREDTYTSLIACVLRSDDALAGNVFRKLDRLSDFRPDHVDIYFRREPAAFCKSKTMATKKDKPDLVLVGSNESERRFVVIEAKVKAGEGPDQLRRYHAICETEKNGGGISGYMVYFMTLATHTPCDDFYNAITHAGLSDLIESSAAPGYIDSLGGVAVAWRDYRDRLVRFENLAVTPNTLVMPWLTSPPDGFVTADDRCRRLVDVVIPASWDSHGGIFNARGGVQALILAQRPGWAGKTWHEHGSPPPLQECFDIHAELTMWLLPEPKSKATLQLHYETCPYMPESKLKKVAPGDELAEFKNQRENFRDDIRVRLLDQGNVIWKPRQSKLQMARTVLDTPPGMTIAELREKLRVPIEQIAVIVDDLVGR